MSTRHRPPRAALWVLNRLPETWREHVIGDLVEDYHQRRAAGAKVRAWLWFWREAVVGMWSLAIPRPVRTTRGSYDNRWATDWGDLMLAARVLRRSPAFMVFCTGTIVIGIGTMTAIFSIVNPLIIQPLPYPDPGRLMMVWERDADTRASALGDPLTAVSNLGYASFVDIVDQSQSLDRATVTKQWRPVVGSVEPERVPGEQVTSSYFATLGVQPMLGRPFTSDEDRPGHNDVVILSNGIWQRRFGGDTTVIGRAVTVNGAPFVVVGIMPTGFDDVIWPGTDLWRPLGYDVTFPMACRTCRHLQMIARLRPHVTPERALTELNAISARMVAAHPTEYPASGMVVVPLQRAVMRAYRPVLVAIGAAAILILLISGANVANLQLARAVRRRAEFAVRTALGARPLDLLRQLLAEGLVLATLGGIGGVVVAWAVLPLLVTQLPPGMPRVSAIHVDRSAFAVAALAVLTVTIIVGLTPAIHRSPTHDELRAGGTTSDPGHRASRTALVVGEFGLALMLLVGAGLVGHSLLRLLAVNVGFDPAHLLSLQLSAVGPVYDKDSAVYAYHDRLLTAARLVPGVRAAALTNQIPLAGNVDRYGVDAADHPLANPELAPSADRYVVSEGFIETMRIPVLRGRTFVNTDYSGSAPKVVLVSRTLAGELWPGDNPLGKRIRMGGPTGQWRTVVGVTGDVHQIALGNQGTGQFYVPERQWPWAEGGALLIVRTAGNPESFAHAVRQAAASVDPTQSISRVETMEHVALESTAQQRVAMLLFSAFATIALILAAGGIDGALAGSVAERTREIGLRQALGAAPGSIVGMVVRQGVQLAVVGSIVGGIGAFAMTRFLRALLFEIQPTDPLTLVSVGTLLSGVALAACLVPAIRAVRIDPIGAIRGG